MMLIKILKSVFYHPFQNGVHFDVFQTFSYAQSYILYACKISAMLSHVYYMYVNFRCHNKLMSTKILKSVFYNTF